MQITVIGSGYVGLVAGACFASTGNTVTCVDNNEEKIRSLNKGLIPIYEPGLEELVKRGAANKRLRFTSSLSEAVANSEIIFMAVGTPPGQNGEPDLSFLKKATQDVARLMDGYRLIVNKSTVPVGSHRVVADWMAEFTKHRFDVASNPEFLKEGSAIEDFLKPDRVVIGTEKEDVYKKLSELYAPFVKQGNPILWMDPISAEITKYACNSFLATRISFMNELSQLCEKVGGDVEEVRKGMTSDARIGKHFLYAGAGYGGSCFPKDIQALIETGKKNKAPLGIVMATEAANEKQKKFLAEKVLKHFDGKVQGKTIALLGLAFKPDTDDVREAPALAIVHELLNHGAKIQAFDPAATENFKILVKDKITYCTEAYDACKNADALVLVTEWNEFKQIDFNKVKSLLKTPVLFDGRNIYNPSKMRALGFQYYGIGRR
jgi:UDPglucose 6-dehydrogenase